MACSRRGERVVDPPRPDIFVIVIDTLRKDHVHAYGYARETTPAIDALAAEGLLFEDAVAQSSWTLPSVMSLMTSRYPAAAVHAADRQLPRLDEAAMTLAEVLRDAGYETFSVATNSYNFEMFGLMQGFEARRLQLSAGADWVVDQAIEYLDERDERGEELPLLVYLHFMDVHEPRRPPAPYDSYFGAADSEKPAMGTRRDHEIALYDGALRFVDAQLDRLVRHVQRSGVERPAIFVVTSDHGEELWDHAELGRRLGMPAYQNKHLYGVGHGHTLFSELVEVPLVISGSGLPRGRVATQVRLVDLAPSVLEVARVDARALSPVGVPLVARWQAGGLDELPALSETQTPFAEHVSLRENGYQYYRVGERKMFFELRDQRLLEPGPGDGQASGAFARLDTMRHAGARLNAILSGAVRPPCEPMTIEAKLLEQLQALGYMGP